MLLSGQQLKDLIKLLNGISHSTIFIDISYNVIDAIASIYRESTLPLSNQHLISIQFFK
jgi:hypothetical protein